MHMQKRAFGQIAHWCHARGERAAARSAPLKGGVVHIKFPLPDGLPIEGSGQAIAIARVLAQAGVGIDNGGG